MKRLLILLLSIVTIVLFTGCSNNKISSSDKKEPTIIRVAFNQSEEHPQYIAMKNLGEKFKEATNGAYEMIIYPNGILGEQGAMAEFVRTGALQMAIVPCSVPEGYDKDFSIVGAPYLYKDMDHLKRATINGVFDDLFHSTRKYSFEVLTVYTAGERNIYSDKPINSPEDLKGSIVRVNDSSTYIRMVSLMGGVGAVMSQSEVYTAIQQGVIDAGENSERVYTDFKHYEVAPYYSYTKHIVHPDVVISNLDFLDSMSEKDMKVFNELLDESVNEEFDLFKESVAQGKKDAEAKGAKFIYPDVEVFRERCKPLLDEIANHSQITNGIYEEIIALREAE